MIDVGRMCMKMAGRDAGKICVVIERYDDHTALIDGQTRRRRCNIKHLEPLDETIEITKGASHEVVAKAFDKLGIETRVSKPKQAPPRPKREPRTKKPAKAEANKAKPAEATTVEKAPVKADSTPAERPKAASEPVAPAKAVRVEKKASPPAARKAAKPARKAVAKKASKKASK